MDAVTREIFTAIHVRFGEKRFSWDFDNTLEHATQIKPSSEPYFVSDPDSDSDDEYMDPDNENEMDNETESTLENNIEGIESVDETQDDDYEMVASDETARSDTENHVDIESDAPGQDCHDPPPRASTRIRKPTERYSPEDFRRHRQISTMIDDMIVLPRKVVLNAMTKILHPGFQGDETSTEIRASEVRIPDTIDEALSDQNPYRRFWSAAIQREYENLTSKNTWILTGLPSGRKSIGCRWVFSAPPNNDGMVKKFKARLVVQGFSQRAGVDYDETFAPVARTESLRTILAIAGEKELCLRQVDVVSAYLNASRLH